MSRSGRRFITALQRHADLIPTGDPLNRDSATVHRELLAALAGAVVEVRAARRWRVAAFVVGVVACLLAGVVLLQL